MAYPLRAVGLRLPPVDTITDFCSYGTPWRKRTRFWSWGLDGTERLRNICKSTHGTCDFSCKQHVLLKGVNKHGKYLTLQAQPYPCSLCTAIARCYLESWQEQLLAAMSKAV